MLLQSQMTVKVIWNSYQTAWLEWFEIISIVLFDTQLEDRYKFLEPLQHFWLKQHWTQAFCHHYNAVCSHFNVRKSDHTFEYLPLILRDGSDVSKGNKLLMLFFSTIWTKTSEAVDTFHPLNTVKTARDWNHADRKDSYKADGHPSHKFWLITLITNYYTCFIAHSVWRWTSGHIYFKIKQHLTWNAAILVSDWDLDKCI